MMRPDFDERGNRLPPVPMNGPLPEELMRNMPRWVVRLERMSWWLMVPWAVCFLLATFYKVTGILLP